MTNNLTTEMTAKSALLRTSAFTGTKRKRAVVPVRETEIGTDGGFATELLIL